MNSQHSDFQTCVMCIIGLHTNYNACCLTYGWTNMGFHCNDSWLVGLRRQETGSVIHYPLFPTFSHINMNLIVIVLLSILSCLCSFNLPIWSAYQCLKLQAIGLHDPLISLLYTARILDSERADADQLFTCAMLPYVSIKFLHILFVIIWKKRREKVCSTMNIETPHTSYSDILQRLVRRYMFKLERLKEEGKRLFFCCCHSPSLLTS